MEDLTRRIKIGDLKIDFPVYVVRGLEIIERKITKLEKKKIEAVEYVYERLPSPADDVDLPFEERHSFKMKYYTSDYTAFLNKRDAFVEVRENIIKERDKKQAEVYGKVQAVAELNDRLMKMTDEMLGVDFGKDFGVEFGEGLNGKMIHVNIPNGSEEAFTKKITEIAKEFN